jgi:hypothetical protein
MKLSLPPKLVEKTSLGPHYLAFVKFSFPVTCLMMPSYVETGRSHRETLQTTLLTWDFIYLFIYFEEANLLFVS